MSRADNQIKTGSYAVTTVFSMPWAKKTAATNKPTRRKNERKVVYDLFEKCSQITTDKYWISIFKDCAREKFPRGFFYKNGLITHRKGNKIKRVAIPNSPYEALSICISFFKAAAGLMSTTDRHMMQKEEEKKLFDEMSGRDIVWKDVKIERIKELLIYEFVNTLTDLRNFTPDEKIELLTTVRKGIMLKCFTSNNINMENGCISSIDGLIYDAKKNLYVIDPVLMAKRPGRKIKGLGIEVTAPKPSVVYMNMWEKYLTGLEKRNNSAGNFHVIETNRSKNSNSNSGEFVTGDTSLTPGGSL